MQNKLHWAIHGQTASGSDGTVAADADKENAMGLDHLEVDLSAREIIQKFDVRRWPQNYRHRTRDGSDFSDWLRPIVDVAEDLWRCVIDTHDDAVIARNPFS